MCRDLSLQLQSPSGTWGLLSKDIIAAPFIHDFCVQHHEIHPWGFHGVSFCLRDGSERGDWRWLDLSGLNPCPPAQCDILVGAAAPSCHVPAEGTRTLLLRQNRGDYLLFPDSCSEWLQAQTSAWGVEAASGINGQHKKFLDLNHVIFLVIRKQDEKLQQMALSGAKPVGVALRMQH